MPADDRVRAVIKSGAHHEHLSGAALLGGILDRLSAAADALASALPGLHEEILEAMNSLRTVVDEAEKLIPDACWPLPKYREMLFVY